MEVDVVAGEGAAPLPIGSTGGCRLNFGVVVSGGRRGGRGQVGFVLSRTGRDRKRAANGCGRGNAKLEFQRPAHGLERRGFQVFAEVGAKPVLKELVGHADDQAFPANRELRGRAKPDLVAVFTNAIRQVSANSRHDLPIVRDHFLRPLSLHGSANEHRHDVSQRVVPKVSPPQGQLKIEATCRESESAAIAFARLSEMLDHLLTETPIVRPLAVLSNTPLTCPRTCARGVAARRDNSRPIVGDTQS